MSDKTLGAWGGDRAALEGAPVSGRGHDADAPDAVRFGRSVLSLIRRRERNANATFEREAVFVLVPRAGFETLPDGCRRAPLLHNGHNEITGQIHFVNPASNGHSLDCSGDAAAMFAMVTSSGYGAHPTLVYSPKKGTSTMSWFPKGVDDAANVELWEVAETDPTAEQITQVINAVHKGELITPDQTQPAFRMWESAPQGRAKEDAEARVQHIVRMALLGAFRHCSVRPEQPGKDGRTDLEIVQDQDRSPEQVVHHAVLELKVLREYGSTGDKYSDAKIATHMNDGLEQAYSYGKLRSFRLSMLCCFDMRAANDGPDKVFAPLTVKATALGVQLRHWFLYRSSEHRRECLVAAALA